MTEFLGGVLALGGTFLFVAALVALFRPLPRLWMATRNTAVAGIALSIVSCAAGGALLPPPPERSASGQAIKANAPESFARAEEQKTDERAEAERKRDTLKGEVLTLWHSVLNAVGPCDRANTALAGALQEMSRNPSLYRAYSLADRGVEACRQSWSQLGELDPPASADRTLRRAFDQTLDRCRNTYLERQQSLEQARTVFDGDLRPSAVESFRRSAENAQNGVLACVAGFMGNAVEAGVPMEQLSAAGGGSARP